MKKLRSLLTFSTKKPIIYSSISKSLIGLAAVLVWDRFVNQNSIRPMELLDTGFFAVGAWFILWAWFQYLALDGMKPFKAHDKVEENKGGRLSFDSLINTNTEAFEGLEEEEKIAVKLCSNLIVALIFIIPSIIAIIL